MALNVVFDFGAVLFHWSPADLVRRQWPELAGNAVDAARLAERFFGGFGGDWAEFDRGRLDRDGIVASIVARTGWSREPVAAVVDAVPEALVVDPATLGLLEDLRSAGVRTHYLSNMPAGYAAVLERRYPLIARFEGGIFSSRVGLIKPERAIFEALVDTYLLTPGQTVLVDDSRANVEAARQAGWLAVQYLDGADCRRRLAALGLPV
jgi:putative hydrolase of the HAD superfamily